MLLICQRQGVSLEDILREAARAARTTRSYDLPAGFRCPRGVLGCCLTWYREDNHAAREFDVDSHIAIKEHGLQVCVRE